MVKKDSYNFLINRADSNLLDFNDTHFVEFNNKHFDFILNNLMNESDNDVKNFFKILPSNKNNGKFKLKSNFSLEDLNQKLNQLNNVPQNLFIAMGFYEYDESSAPLFLIPVFIEDNQLFRNYNINIQFNKLLVQKFNLKEIDNLDSDSILAYLEDIGASKDIYLGSFDLSKYLTYLDLQDSNWVNSKEKLDNAIDNIDEYYCKKEDVNSFNMEMEKIWAHLDDNFNKISTVKFSQADLIKNLLLKNKTMLYIGDNIDDYLDDEFKVLNLNLNSTMSKEDFYGELHDSLNYTFDFDGSKLNELNKSKNRLNFNKDEFKKSFGKSYLSPFTLVDTINISKGNIDSYGETVEEFIISNSTEYSNSQIDNYKANLAAIQSTYSKFAPCSENYYNNLSDLSQIDSEKFNLISDNLENKIESLISKINELHKNYGVKKLTSFNDSDYFSNCSIIAKNPIYISDNDKIDDFLKDYEDYLKKTSGEDIEIKSEELKLSINEIYEKSLEYKQPMIEISKNMDLLNNILLKLKNLFKSYNISNINNLKEFNYFCKFLDIFSQKPVLIEDSKELNQLIKEINEYDELNTKKLYSAEYYKKDFSEVKGVISGIANSLNDYLQLKDDYSTLNKLLNKIIRSCKQIGYDFKSLADIDSSRDDLELLTNKPVIFEDKNYPEIIEFLDKFKNKLSSMTIGDYLNKLKFNLEKNIENVFKLYDDLLFSENRINSLNKNISCIEDLSKKLGLSFENYNEYLELKTHFDLLEEKPQLVEKKEFEEFIENLDQFKNVNDDDLSLKDFILNSKDKLESHVNNVIGQFSSISDFHDDFVVISEYSNNIIALKKEMGINVSELCEFKENTDNLRILNKNPILIEDPSRLTQFVNDYSNILVIEEKYGASDKEDLIKKLKIKLNEIQKPIKSIISNIEAHSVNFNKINNAINNIENSSDILSKSVKTQKLSKLNEIENFISNLNVLNHKPIYVEDYTKGDSYIDIIQFLKENNLITSNDYLKETYLALSGLNNLELTTKIDTLKNIFGNLDSKLRNNVIDDLNSRFDYILDNKDKLNVKLEILSNINFEENLNKLRILNDKINSSPVKDALYEEINLKDKVNVLEENYNNVSYRLGINKDFDKVKKILIRYYSNTLPSSDSKLISDFNDLLDYADNYDRIYKDLEYYLTSNNELTVNQLCDELNFIVFINNEIKEIYQDLLDIFYNSLIYNKNFMDIEVMYDNEIKPFFEKYLPNTFKGLDSSIDELKEEWNINKKYSELVNQNFFKKESLDSYSNFEEDLIDNHILILKNSKSLIEDKFDEIKKDVDFTKSVFDKDIYDMELSDLVDLIKSLLLDVVEFKDIRNKINNDIENIDYFNEFSSFKVLSSFVPNKHVYLSESGEIKNNYNLIINLNQKILNKYFKELFKDSNPSIEEVNSKVDEYMQFTELFDNNIVNSNSLNYISNTSVSDINANLDDLNKNVENLYEIIAEEKLSAFNFDENVSNLRNTSLEYIDLSSKLQEDIKELNKFSKISNDLNIVADESRNAIELVSEKTDEYNKFDFNEIKQDINQISENVELFDSINKFENPYVDIADIIENSPKSIFDFKNKLQIDDEFTKLYNVNVFAENTISSINDNSLMENISLIDSYMSIYEKLVIELYNKNVLSKFSFNEILEKNNAKLIKINELKQNISKINKISSINNDILDNMKALCSSIYEFNNKFSPKNAGKYIDKIKSIEADVDEVINLADLLDKYKINDLNMFNADVGKIDNLLADLNISKRFDECVLENKFGEKTFEFIKKSKKELVSAVDKLLSDVDESIKLFDKLNINKTDDIGINVNLVKDEIKLIDEINIEKNKLIESLNFEQSDVVDYNIKKCFEIIDDAFKFNDDYLNENNHESNKNNLSSLKENLSLTERLYELEKSIDTKDNIIKRHFNGIWKGYNTSPEDLKNKMTIDKKLTKLFDEKYIDSSSLNKLTNLTESQLKEEFNIPGIEEVKSVYNKTQNLPSSIETKDFKDLLDTNKIKIKDFTNLNKYYDSYNNDLDNNIKDIKNIYEIIAEYNNKFKVSKDFKNLKEVFANYDAINPILKTKNQIMSDYTDIIEKYFNESWKGFTTPINQLNENHNKNKEFSKLVDEKFFTQKTITHIENGEYKKIQYLISLIEFNIDELRVIVESFNKSFKNDYIDKNDKFSKINSDIHEFNKNRSDLSGWITFKKQCEKLREISNELVDLILSDKLNPKIFLDLFDYNFANSYLNEICDENSINKSDITSEFEIEKEIIEINKEIKDFYSQYKLSSIFKNSLEFKNESTVELFNENQDIINIVNNSRGIIQSLKPIISCDILSLYHLLIPQNFESSFDYILLDNDNTLSDYELTSLLLRSKNKIILLDR